MRLVLAVFAGVLWHSRAPAADILIAGIGTRSCATWKDPANDLKEAGEQWALGFWSALNAAGSSGVNVGHTTDAQGIVGAVSKVCEHDPALPLWSATSRAFYALAAQHR